MYSSAPGQHFAAPAPVDRAYMLAGLRRASGDGGYAGPQLPQPYNTMAMPYAGQPAYAPPQHQVDEYQQAQLEYQLRQLQLKNLEMQSALLAQAAAAQQQQQHYQAPQPPYARPVTPEGHARQSALQALDRAQRQRTYASANGALMTTDPLPVPTAARGKRLSFGESTDASALAEHARARHARNVSVDSPLAATFDGGAEKPTERPKLVLSKPGEAFPDTSPRRRQASRFGATAAALHDRSASSTSTDSSSAGGDDTSDASAPDSSTTSVGTRLGDSPVVGKQLNAGAASFTPSNAVVASSPVARTPRFAPELTAAMATRQPYGPTAHDDADFAARNFAGRKAAVRRQSILSIRRSRSSFHGVMSGDALGAVSPRAVEAQA